jgi:hypothetical protein
VLGFGLGTAGLAAVGAGGLAVTGNLGRAERAARRPFNSGGPNDPPPDVPTGGLVTGTFRSAAMKNADVSYAVSYPPGSPTDAKLPVVLELYGRGGNHLVPFAAENLALDRYQAQVVGAGSPPFAVATIAAGPDMYWQKRASGIDPQGLILDEYLPRLAERGLRVDRFALHGESMGATARCSSPNASAGSGSLPSPSMPPPSFCGRQIPRRWRSTAAVTTTPTT